MKKIPLLCILLTVMLNTFSQMKPEDTEIYQPVPPRVKPGKYMSTPPSDALILFDGSNMDAWEQVKDPASPQKWILENNAMRVDKKVGDIQTKKHFTDYQLHIEYLIPAGITGSGQARGNSGIFMAAPQGQGGYELQVLDNYENTTYVNGQAGSIYKQSPPMANACLPPGEWQSFNIAWKAPRFNADGGLQSPARITAWHNGVLVQNNYELKGHTPYIGLPAYKAHGPAPILLQSHGDPSEPISFRNIWIREL